MLVSGRDKKFHKEIFLNSEIIQIYESDGRLVRDETFKYMFYVDIM